MGHESHKKYWKKENKRYLKIDEGIRQKTTNIAKGVNSLAVFVAFSFLFFPKFYVAQLLILLILPWLAGFHFSFFWKRPLEQYLT